MNKMRICFCIDKLDSGGAERVLTTLANEFSKLDCDVCLIETSSRGSTPFYKIDKEVEHIQLLSSIEKKVNLFKKIKLLRKEIKRIKPDVVVTFKYPVNIYTAFALVNIKCVHIVSERNNPYTYSVGRISNFLKKPIFKSADGCVFQTQDAMKYYFKKNNQKAIIIPNPVESSESTLWEPIKKRKQTIISVGRLVPQKNTKLLIDAFEDFNQMEPNYVLKIYGTGILQDELIDYAKTKKCGSSVLFLGNSSSWMQENKDASLFVLSSDYEGMPNSLMEAMAIGLPCISTDCPIGGPRYLIQDGVNGFLVKTNDKMDLVDKMCTLVRNKNLSFSFSYANKDMIEKYSKEVIAKEWYGFVKDIYERKFDER